MGWLSIVIQTLLWKSERSLTLSIALCFEWNLCETMPMSTYKSVTHWLTFTALPNGSHIVSVSVAFERAICPLAMNQCLERTTRWTGRTSQSRISLFKHTWSRSRPQQTVTCSYVWANGLLPTLSVEAVIERGALGCTHTQEVCGGSSNRSTARHLTWQTRKMEDWRLVCFSGFPRNAE